jgi:voltage-gated potassium channel
LKGQVTTICFRGIVRKTDFGRLVASFMMLMGWGTLAVPTTRTCQVCLTEGQTESAKFCFSCGAELPVYQHDEVEAPAGAKG